MWKEKEEREGGKKKKKEREQREWKKRIFLFNKIQKKKPLVQYVSAESVDFSISIV